MKKNLNIKEGYFSFNTPTGNINTNSDKKDSVAQPAFNDFLCMPESSKTKKVETDAPKSDINFF